MNLKSKLITAAVGVTIIALVTGWGWINLRARSSEPEVSMVEELTVVQDFSYIGLTDEERINHAEAIFLGKVINISPTRWNQDSGEPWDDGLLIHEIEFEVIQPIVDTVGLDKQVKVTVLGNSPLDKYAEYDLNVGEQAVVFVRETDLAWRERGSRRVLYLVEEPTKSYYLQRDDGLYQGSDDSPLSLEELIAHIAQERPVLEKP